MSNHKDRRMTKRCLVNRFMSNQRNTSKADGYDPPSYTVDELYEWCENNYRFHALYRAWVKSGYDKWLRPSIDRKDDYKGYSLDNIQMMTWRENDLKGKQDRKNGVNNKTNKAVSQYTLDGKYIATYFSRAEAFRVTNIHCISKAINGIATHAGGYIWKNAE